MNLPHQKIAIPGIPRTGVRILVVSDDAQTWSAAACEIRECGYFLGVDAIFAFPIAYKARI